MLIDPDRAEELLEALGVEVDHENGDELVALCPMHEERTGKIDHHPSWSFNRETGLHNCFACGYGGGVLGLVADLLGSDFSRAEEWLKEFEVGLAVRVKKLESDPYQKERNSDPIPFTRARLSVFEEPPDWALEARHLTREAAEAYGVLWDPQKEAWITPLFDGGSLIGYQMKGQGHRLFRNFPKGMEKSKTLFGLDRFVGPRMIVVESPLDAVRFLSAGVEGAVASCGAKISTEQFDLMLQADELVLALDSDEAGRLALKRFHEMAKARVVPFRQFSYAGTDAKDPGDMTDEQLIRGLENSKDSIRGLSVLLSA